VAPASCGFGAVLLLAGLTQAGAALFTIGGFVFVAVSIRVVLRQPEPFSVTMLAGARLRLFYAAILVYGAAALTFTLAVDPLARDWAARLSGLAMLGLALWLLLFDMARRTVRQTGLVRFIAVCLLSGYAWLAIAGTLLACLALPPAGLLYDAILHCFFLGFVFAMIFGHAPIIFPSVLGLPVRFTRVLYIPLALLHLSLLTRVCGDLFGFVGARSVGGAGNAAAIVLFLGLFAGNALRENAGKQLTYTIRRQT
jgi:hypothetical protein